MAFKFFTSRIVTAPISLQDALANAAKAPKQRTLDEIVAGNKAVVKTAAAAGPVVKTAEKVEQAPAAPVAPATKVEVKVAEAVKQTKEAKGGDFGGKKAPPFGSKEKKDEKGKGKGKDKKDEPLKEEEEACMASKSLKLTKDLDFRAWEAETVKSAWASHGSLEKCIASVKGKTSDPSTYCGLLKCAADTATKMTKVAEKTAPQQDSPTFKKFAKLSDKERSRLYGYWTQLYGEGYAKAMLEDYVG